MEKMCWRIRFSAIVHAIEDIYHRQFVKFACFPSICVQAKILSSIQAKLLKCSYLRKYIYQINFIDKIFGNTERKQDMRGQ